ncbi:transcription factor BIM1 isoform X3 [Abrus precatorius]|uniref:Transcription factor BIM1 isoform X3 n=1 Tax=Abrus precatorius TaxID=3816 RepID=A0A8B8JDD8_ABRPR|nr:transcription factor BIM1 isoform X3 [Abrus precatorius]
MELPQARPFGTEGRKPTHDFLSLYSNSTAQQDPRPSSQGSYLKTHDFLQPLERQETKASAKEEATDEISSVAQKPPSSAPPPSVEHLLPGGIGTYSISHISCFNNNNQRVPKPEAALYTVRQATTSTDRNDDNSNCSSYTSSGFTLWEESSVKRGKTGKENNVGEKPTLGGTESSAKLGQWTLTERTSQSFPNNRHSSFSSRSSSQTNGQKNQSFIEMMKSAKDSAQDEVLENEETFFLKKEPSNTQRELRVKVDGKSTDQKPNTPRSKHSATEQRRRSKINDRFQTLRELIPHSDQKRDKASFLLEVIEYIHFLQEKVHKYEGSLQGWSNEPEKLMAWQRNNDKPAAESFQPRGTDSGSCPSPTLLFASKVDEKNITITQTIPRGTQNLESGFNTATTSKTMDHQAGTMNKAFPIPISSQLNFFTPTQIGGPVGIVSQLAHRSASDAENTKYHPSVECQTMAATNEKLKEKELAVEGGAISISSVYSKGLLHTLTHALQSSGVDLSQASISVQIELGKQANIRPTVPMSMCGAKDDEVPSNNQKMMRSRVASSGKSDQAVKKLKTCRS